MTDVVVTIPKAFRWDGAPGKVGLDAWLAEGGLPGSPPCDYYVYWLGWRPPDIEPGERVYAYYDGCVIGFAPLVAIARASGRFGLRRGDGAVWCTIPEVGRGFRGFRYRWWDRGQEIPFDVPRPVTAVRVLFAANVARFEALDKAIREQERRLV